MEMNTVVNMDALEFLKGLPDGCVDAVITDPPYGFGLDKWDKTPDIERVVNEVCRVLKPTGFFAFTMIAPYDLAWRNVLEGRLKFFEHISWVKRGGGAYGRGLIRSHESLFLYAMPEAKYHQTKGKYADVKIPGVLFDVISIEGIQRSFDELRSLVNTGRLPSPRRHKSAYHKAHLGKFRKDIIGARASGFVNFTTVWSFMPENKRNDRKSIDHASVKPLDMFVRLVELLTAPGALVIDPFCGSGTTALAARNTGHQFIAGDSDPHSVSVTNERLNEPYTPSFFNLLSEQE
jgi:site-specific DNA-methyltransferase (adenine-specific)